jgi:hypothetical protein
MEHIEENKELARLIMQTSNASVVKRLTDKIIELSGAKSRPQPQPQPQPKHESKPEPQPQSDITQERAKRREFKGACSPLCLAA